MPRARRKSVRVWAYDSGTSQGGPISMTARVIAPTRMAALRKLRRWTKGRRVQVTLGSGRVQDIEYVGVEFNANGLSINDLTEIRGEM